MLPSSLTQNTSSHPAASNSFDPSQSSPSSAPLAGHSDVDQGSRWRRHKQRNEDDDDDDFSSDDDDGMPLSERSDAMNSAHAFPERRRNRGGFTSLFFSTRRSKRRRGILFSLKRWAVWAVTGTASSTFLPLPNSSKPRRRDCRPQTLVLHFFRILAVAVVLFTGYAILLTLYMLLIREGGPTGFRAPTIHHLTIPNPFSSMSCYTHQLRFLMGTVVGNRIIHKAKCSDEVLEAVIANERTWPPKPRGGIYADRFLREQGGRICDPGDGAELEFADGTLKFPNSSTKCIPNVEWVIYATNCNNGINRLAKNLRDAGIPLTILGMRRGWRGWGQRIRAYHDYLVSVTEAIATPIPESSTTYKKDDLEVIRRSPEYLRSKARSRVMIFTDGDDVLASPSCDPATIAKRFMDRPRAASPILFSAERMVWPIWQWKSIYEDDIKNSSKFVHIPEGGRDPRKTVRRIQSYTRGLYEYTKYPFEYPFEFPHGRHGFSQDPKQSTTFRYLNAGTLVGRALDARAFLGEAYINECGDDQARFAELFLGGGVKVRKESARKVIEAMEKAEVEVEMAVDELEKELILWSKRGGTFGVDVERRVEEVEKARRRLRGFVVEMDKVDREVDESVLDANGALEGVRRPFIDLDFENHMTSALFAVWSVDMEMSEMGRKSLRMYETQPSLKDFGVVNQGEKGLWDRIERALGPGGAVETEEEVGGGRGICVFHQNGRKYENRVLEWMARGFGMWYREDTMGKDGLALNNPGVE